MSKLHLLLTLLGALSSNAAAYEQATHALLTSMAYDASLFSSSGGTADLISRTLGLNTFAPFGSDEQYFEGVHTAAGTPEFMRSSQLFEKRILANLFKSPASQTPAKVWLMYGAIREDDNPTEDPATPQDVAPGLRRPLHHFYDPAYNRPLTSPYLLPLDSDVHTNPDWAIGSKDSFGDPNAPELLRRNSFTVVDAREAMFRALTLMSDNGDGYVDFSNGKDLVIKQQWRQAYWSTAFRALGDVLHLNQDMAQPQHTRNEAHSGQLCPTSRVCLGGHTSVYEKYINARALTQRNFNSLAPFHTTLDILNQAFPLAAYPIPTFARYTDYWSTTPGDRATQGKGLADYSNRGFFTAGKNLGSSEYPSPSSNTSDYQVRTVIPVRWDGTPTADNAPSHVYYGSVRDQLQDASTPDVPLTSFGMWDQFLQAKSAAPDYTLNRINYDAMADLLLPRAVAYSAGLINFFFRGRIEIALPDEGVFALADHGVTKGFTKLRAKITNATASFVDAQNNPQPQRMNGGTFFAVIRYHTDKQYVDSLDTVVGTSPCDDFASVVNPAKLDASTQCRDGVEQIIVSKPFTGIALDAGGQALVEFDFQNSPIPYAMTDVILQIVYRGPLGSETDAVAVGTIDVSEPTYFTYHNATDYIHLGEHVYTRGEVDSNPQLLALVQPQYCVDYRQTPPHLVSSCLNQFKLDLAVSFGDLSNPIAQVEGLPNRRFVRVAWLTTADDGFNSPAKKAARGVSVMVRPHVDGDSARPSEKASLNQRGTCLPLDPFDIPARHSQMTVISPTQVGYRVDRLDKLRDVNGWFSTSCIVNGDDATPGTPDDRTIVMSPLVPMTDEVLPYPVNIMPAYLAAPGAIAAM
jgi:hypothetical protein